MLNLYLWIYNRKKTLVVSSNIRTHQRMQGNITQTWTTGIKQHRQIAQRGTHTLEYTTEGYVLGTPKTPRIWGIISYREINKSSQACQPILSMHLELTHLGYAPSRGGSWIFFYPRRNNFFAPQVVFFNVLCGGIQIG